MLGLFYADGIIFSREYSRIIRQCRDDRACCPRRNGQVQVYTVAIQGNGLALWGTQTLALYGNGLAGVRAAWRRESGNNWRGHNGLN